MILIFFHVLSSCFQDNHGRDIERHVVLLFPFPASEELKVILDLPRFKRNVTYLRGKITDERARHRVALSTCRAVFILANNHSAAADEEDVSNLLQTLAVENFHPDIETFVQVIKPESVAFIRSAGGDYVFSLQVLRNKLIGHNMKSPGFSTLFRNLFTSGINWRMVSQNYNSMVQTLHHVTVQ